MLTQAGFVIIFWETVRRALLYSVYVAAPDLLILLPTPAWLFKSVLRSIIPGIYF